MRRLALLVLLLAPSTGCVLYFGDDDDNCDDWGNGGAAEPAQGFRNPWSGQCEFRGGGGGGGGGGCGDRPLSGGSAPGAPTGGTTDPGGNAGDALEAPIMELDWATCEGFCNSLDEFSCVASDGCRAIYVDPCPPGSACDAIPFFSTCWGTAPSGPIRGGGCGGLDAYACSQHDDCSALHFNGFGSVGEFEACQDEQAQPGGCYSDFECAPGEQCTADEECLPPPGCDPNSGMGCDSACWGKCVPVDPGTCTDSSQCPMGQQCSIDPACMGGPGGNCTGTCVDPPPPPPACANLDEATCIDMIDGCITYADGTTACADATCTPLYEGTDCVCDAAGDCTCSTWTFLSCSDS